jgi:hypothetical protein
MRMHGFFTRFVIVYYRINPRMAEAMINNWTAFHLVELALALIVSYLMKKRYPVSRALSNERFKVGCYYTPYFGVGSMPVSFLYCGYHRHIDGVLYGPAVL